MACQFDIGFARGTGLEAAIVTRPGNACELAKVLNVDHAGAGCNHGFDDFREARTIEPCRSAASKPRKAFCENRYRAAVVRAWPHARRSSVAAVCVYWR